jgi:hypothetical protein
MPNAEKGEANRKGNLRDHLGRFDGIPILGSGKGAEARRAFLNREAKILKNLGNFHQKALFGCALEDGCLPFPDQLCIRPGGTDLQCRLVRPFRVGLAGSREKKNRKQAACPEDGSQGALRRKTSIENIARPHYNDYIPEWYDVASEGPRDWRADR